VLSLRLEMVSMMQMLMAALFVVMLVGLLLDLQAARFLVVSV
jgi:hypothetical protein